MRRTALSSRSLSLASRIAVAALVTAWLAIACDSDDRGADTGGLGGAGATNPGGAGTSGGATADAGTGGQRHGVGGVATDGGTTNHGQPTMTGGTGKGGSPTASGGSWTTSGGSLTASGGSSTTSGGSSTTSGGSWTTSGGSSPASGGSSTASGGSSTTSGGSSTASGGSSAARGGSPATDGGSPDAGGSADSGGSPNDGGTAGSPGGQGGNAAQEGLGWPIDCTVGVDCSIGYPDIDGDGQAFDCGPPGYTGHQGTDISFIWDMMDAGTDVYAAESGDVLWVFDGHFDRCPDAMEPECQEPSLDMNPGVESGYMVCTDAQDEYCLGTNYTSACYWCFYGANVVVIRHPDGATAFATRYDHLREGSIVVEPGQHVERGEKIAEVGSAGNSTGPHLHFEVWVGGFYVLADPWAGTCGPNTGSSLWDPALGLGGG